MMSLATLWIACALLVVSGGSAHAAQGVLDGRGWCGFDWLRPGGDFVVAQAALHQGVSISASFRWMGNGNLPKAEGKTGEHVILGLVQGTLSAQASQFCPASGRVEPLLNSSRHGGGQQALHRRGVGILLAPVGLVVEVWNGDGTATTWSAEHDGCALSVPAGIVSTPCIPLGCEEGDAFMNPRLEDFAIARGRTYWLDLHYTQQTATRGIVEAQLSVDARNGPVLQRARMVVELPAWVLDEPIDTVVGRTAPESPDHSHPSLDIVFSLDRSKWMVRTP